MKMILAILLSLYFSSSQAYAYSLDDFEEYISVPQVQYFDGETLSLEFSISSGIVRDSESTFDSVRVLIGSTLENTSVSIFQYDEEFRIVDNHELFVGSLGVFSQSVNLLEGKNFFHIFAQNEDSTFEQASLISRKPLEIKTELERGIILPSKRNTQPIVTEGYDFHE